MTNNKNQNLLLRSEHVWKVFGDGNEKKTILKDMSMSVHEGEFVAILGPSGSGKSTFLRVLSGLIPPTEGHVYMHEKELQGINNEVSIVFQNFALYPWLTVRKNVALGLLHSTISEEEKEKRITDAIHAIGLKGFDDAFPREISGGMKQRVGFARALVVQPTILMMDEPFSALDVLTAENLRHELLTLWLEKKIPTKTIIMVTHNIDEAVSMADKVCILSSNPGEIRVELEGLPVETRMQKGSDHTELVDSIYQIMTNPKKNPQTILHDGNHIPITLEESPYQVLPQIGISKLKAYIKKLMLQGGKESIRELNTNISLDDLLPLIEMMDILGLGGVEENRLFLTELGDAYAHGNTEEEKQILKKQLIANVSLIQFIMQQLEDGKHTIHTSDVLKHLHAYFPHQDAIIQLKTALTMGIYAGLFSYNRQTGRISLIEN